MLLLMLGLAARAAERQGEDFTTSLTFSPLHLFVPIAEVTGERRLKERGSAALIIGYGHDAGFGLAKPFCRGYAEGVGGDLRECAFFEIGAQARYYVLGGFRGGLSLGVEALDQRLRAQFEDGYYSQYVEHVRTLSPLLGAKLALGFGLTVDLQVGPQLRARRDYLDTPSEDQKWKREGFVTMNLGLGCSF